MDRRKCIRTLVLVRLFDICDKVWIPVVSYFQLGAPITIAASDAADGRNNYGRYLIFRQSVSIRSIEIKKVMDINYDIEC
jgi:hypothetical protein